jgi:hypothetical protein
MGKNLWQRVRGPIPNTTRVPGNIPPVATPKGLGAKAVDLAKGIPSAIGGAFAPAAEAAGGALPLAGAAIGAGAGGYLAGRAIDKLPQLFGGQEISDYASDAIAKRRTAGDVAQANQAESMVSKIADLKAKVVQLDQQINQARAAGDNATMQALQQKKLALMQLGVQARQQFYGDTTKGYGPGGPTDVAGYQQSYGLKSTPPPVAPKPTAPQSSRMPNLTVPGAMGAA